MFRRKDRTLEDNFKLCGIFMFLGGYTGIVTAMILKRFVNCMSCNVTETGISLGSFDFKEAFLFGSIVTSFIIGAFLSAKALDMYKRGHVRILGTESAVLALAAFVPRNFGLIFAALGMGLQNGLTSYTTWSKGRVRTTHVTGTTTDIGISLANGDIHTFYFTIFQASTYFAGAIIGFQATKIFGSYAFLIGAVFILAITMFDYLVFFWRQIKNVF